MPALSFIPPFVDEQSLSKLKLEASEKKESVEEDKSDEESHFSSMKKKEGFIVKATVRDDPATSCFKGAGKRV
jgi:hypothetical protein